MVALTVMIVIISSSVVVFRGASTAWMRGERTAFKYGQARAIIDRMSAEIGQVIISPARRAYLIGDRKGMEAVKAAGTADELFFIAPLAGSIFDRTLEQAGGLHDLFNRIWPRLRCAKW